MGIQPTELSTNDVHPDEVPVQKAVAGRSPTQIAIARPTAAAARRLSRALLHLGFQVHADHLAPLRR